MDCEMHIFSSECQTCNVVIDREMGCYDIVKHRSSKVVSASGTCLAWINMWLAYYFAQRTKQGPCVVATPIVCTTTQECVQDVQFLFNTECNVEQ